MRRDVIEAELLHWMREGATAKQDPERFERLALELFAFQFEACAPYARLCESLDRRPGQVSCVEEIPAVPTGAFKEFELRCFEAEDVIKTFRTSGTTLERRGELHLDTLALYEASLLASLRRCLLPGLSGRDPAMHFLAPSPNEAPDSSLTHMFDVLRREEGASCSAFYLHAGQLALESFTEAVSRAQRLKTPALIAGTSFAFVHFLDATRTDPDRWQLPGGSRVMETGGFKGRSRSVPREALRREIANRFGLTERDVVNQYGMTELGSQFYDSTLVDRGGPRRKLSPPWARVRLVDPESGRNVAPGETGMIVIHDLANSGSIAAIQTADVGRAVLDEEGRIVGFDVIGREAGAEARGCSIATDAMLEAAGGARR